MINDQVWKMKFEKQYKFKAILIQIQRVLQLYGASLWLPVTTLWVPLTLEEPMVLVSAAWKSWNFLGSITLFHKESWFLGTHSGKGQFISPQLSQQETLGLLSTVSGRWETRDLLQWGIPQQSLSPLSTEAYKNCQAQGAENEKASW